MEREIQSNARVPRDYHTYTLLASLPDDERAMSDRDKRLNSRAIRVFSRARDYLVSYSLKEPRRRVS